MIEGVPVLSLSLSLEKFLAVRPISFEEDIAIELSEKKTNPNQ